MTAFDPLIRQAHAIEPRRGGNEARKNGMIS